MSHRAKPSANPRPAGIEAVKTTLQKTAIHRDRRDRRRATYFPMIRLENPNHLHSTAGDATRSPTQITDFHHLPRFWPYTVPAYSTPETTDLQLLNPPEHGPAPATGNSQEIRGMQLPSPRTSLR